MIPKTQAKKEKIDKLDFIKLKTCVSKGSTRKVKRMGKIFPSYISDKDVVSRTYKELLQLKNPIQKLSKELNRHFFKKGKQKWPIFTGKYSNIISH